MSSDGLPKIAPMKPTGHILLLAGSAEARQIAVALTDRGIALRTVLSEPPRGANPMPVPFEVVSDPTPQLMIGAASDAIAILDASHGFDGRMTELGHAAALQLDLPFVTLSRPIWEVCGEEHWHRAADVSAAMAMIAPSERVFSATGWQSLPEYAGFKGACLMVRQTSPHDRPPPFEFVELVFGKPPFTVSGERTLFQELAVDTLIARNLGGIPSRPKLDAARELGLKVILIDRPKAPRGIQVVHNIADALQWVEKL
ncbi:precorrin-6A/cobalt-precorrin-6A reductase [Sulfitobacter sp. F26204]|uniref:precorrin-6A/cobalt-precorrin-6A reductase n=1 Tax=Sulfitobacter sp. F26204 TaxID=2996014 RepID=UPI00225E1419|nr:precorrin-6A/cobalt-precorrin-6A reductase [Sulfitobacter sp. F26204]MCX7559529.1 precorrin-6A/cobalt-precorrin-6A reductase [Sulfitobacter sp. F26204]